MKVRELIEQLSKHDPELEILCVSEDLEQLQVRLFHVDDVNSKDAEICRSSDNELMMKCGTSPVVRKFVVLNITVDV